MGFWEYPDSESDDDASGTPDDAVLRCRRSPNKYNELNRKALHGPDNFDVRAPKHGPKKHAIELADDDDDDEDVATLPRKKKRKSFLKRISLDQEERPEEQSKDALRLQELQQQAMKAFLDDEDDDDEDEDSDLEDENDVHVKSSPVRVRAPALVEEIDDDEEEVKAELEREQEVLMRRGAAAANCENTLVLKAQCKHGQVQIRQGADDNFVEFMEKFRKYAIQKGWAQKKSKMILDCDGDHVDLAKNSPDDFDLEEGMALDVLIK